MTKGVGLAALAGVSWFGLPVMAGLQMVAEAIESTSAAFAAGRSIGRGVRRSTLS